ncbi:MAG: hypothetical protein ACLGI9_10755 [Thermoanaerobaculia bacterium]
MPIDREHRGVTAGPYMVVIGTMAGDGEGGGGRHQGRRRPAPPLLFRGRVR